MTTEQTPQDECRQPKKIWIWGSRKTNREGSYSDNPVHWDETGEEIPYIREDLTRAPQDASAQSDDSYSVALDNALNEQKKKFIEKFGNPATPTDESKRAALEAFRYIKDVVLPQYERLRNAVKKQDGMEHLLSGVYKLREYKAELDTLSAALSAADSKAVVDVEELKDEVRRYFNAFATEYLEMMHNHGDAIIDYLASQGFLRQQVQGWRTIDSAPKDGTPILLMKYGENESGEDLGCWWVSKGYWRDEKQIKGTPIKLPAKFVDMMGDALVPPTHWQPLPYLSVPDDKGV